MFLVVHNGPMSSLTEFDLQRTTEPIVDDLLEGYNATILTYGQTSSGKTFTVEVCSIEVDGVCFNWHIYRIFIIL